MGAHSTIYVSRDRAMAYMMQRLLGLSDSQLEEMLDLALDERLYRARIAEAVSGPDDHLLA